MSQRISTQLLRGLAGSFFLPSLILLSGCGRTSQVSDSTHAPSPRHDSIPTMQPSFHADNDIAMVVGSLADALAVGEAFDPAAYNFTGILTDGGGAPLYIDSSRNPGVWTVKVLSDTSAEITNLNEGDLVASDIVDYLTACLHITSHPLESPRRRGDGERLVFPLRKGYITFTAPEGIGGCLITVALSDSI